ncbi:MAG: hypothetical protein JNJ70_20555 [Verrucomicrobiales bacterium]|nr:hypothetical protein [Verrucomicrobiales bacterium]
MTRRLLIIATLVASAFAAAPQEASAALNPNDEYIIVSGGPSLMAHESYRREAHRHDRWWGNFIRTARIRIEQLQKASNGAVNITWLVYRPGYETRQAEDGQPLISNIESVRDKYKIRLVWFSSSDEVINYINSGQNRSSVKVSGFEFFGHSNKFCFVFDYSNHILGASRSFLHQSDLKKINRKAFARGAYCKSWGCHSGESFTAEWKRVTGVKMIGAIGKTDYSATWQGTLPFVSPGGRWTS